MYSKFLDYSNRNEDGSVGKLPDSLISIFTTRNGREVKRWGYKSRCSY